MPFLLLHQWLLLPAGTAGRRVLQAAAATPAAPGTGEDEDDGEEDEDEEGDDDADNAEGQQTDKPCVVPASFLLVAQTRHVA